MTLVLRQREATKDIDAYFAVHAEAIREATARVAREQRLRADWLNNAVKGFLYAQPDTTLWLETPGLRAYVPDMSYITEGTDPWLAIGQFLDDWRGTDPAHRLSLVAEPLSKVSPEYVRWAALLAAAVDYQCAQEGLSSPPWTGRPEYRLPEPWFLYPGWRLRGWQLAETAVPFRMRNIFGGDRILSRV